MTTKIKDWRHDGSLHSVVVYKRRFAFRKTKCADGTEVWFRSYYTKYETWVDSSTSDEYGHTDKMENITEAEYIVRRLTEGL